MPQHKQGKGGTRKFGRNKVKCDIYRKHKSVRNKLRKLNSHLANHPNDGVAKAALKSVYSV